MSDLTRRGVLRALQEELPDPVKECEKSVMEDNPDMERSTAIAICRDQLEMSEREELAEQYDLPRVLEEDPCWDGYVMVGTKTEDGNTVPNCVPEDSAEAADLSECPEGQIALDGGCVPVEQVDNTPPSALEHGAGRQHAPLLLNDGDVGAIERTEESDGTVRYSNIKLLAPGKWTDQASEETIHYSAEGIANMDITEDARLNIMHDVSEAGDPNPPSDIGHIDPDTAQTDATGNLYADIVLEMDSAGSEYADENLQSALESGGEMGVSGPSVEIPAEGQRLEWDREQGLYELKEGKISGAGLVWNPASKDVDFTRETATREIAMMSGNSDKALYTKAGHMSPDLDELRERLDLSDDISDDTLIELRDAGALALEDDEEEEEEEDEEMPDEMQNEGGEDEEEDEEEEDMEMADAMDMLEEQIDDIWGKIDELEEMMATESAMSDAREELADAEEVKTLRETVETLDKELGEARTMSDGSSADTTEDWKDWATADPSVDTDPNAL